MSIAVVTDDASGLTRLMVVVYVPLLDVPLTDETATIADELVVFLERQSVGSYCLGSGRMLVRAVLRSRVASRLTTGTKRHLTGTRASASLLA